MPRRQPGDPEPQRCSKKRKRSGEPCGSWAVKGSDPPACRMHIGRNSAYIEQVRSRAEALKEAGRLASRAGADMHPIDHLLDALYRAAAEVEVFGQFVADLDNKGEVDAANEPGRLRGWAEWRTEIDPETDRPRRVLDLDPLMVQGADKTIQTHPFLKEYNDALERRARFAALAMKAGVAERQIMLEEQRAMMVATAVRGILTEMGVKIDRKAVAVIKQHLLAAGDTDRKRGVA